jgi:hypothetical protein
MHSLWQDSDGQHGGERAANLARSTLRRNGNRFHAGGRSRRWSATRAQTRLVAFRRDTCAVEATGVFPQATRSLEPRRLRMVGKGVLLASFIALMGMWTAAQSSAPVVTMNVTLPSGRTQEISAAESGLATVRLEDGTEYGFRPTIQDDMPWDRIVVTIFRTATANAPTQTLGEVELKRGSPPVDAKTNPSFKVAVPKVSPPATQTRSTT